MTKKLSLFLFSLSSTLISIYVAFVAAENFFFDKLLYNKSPIHGYDKYETGAIKHKNNPWIEKRIRDLRLVYAESRKNRGNEKILGAKTQNQYNIALIGDSIAYGTGVRENESFGRVLETKLNMIRPTKVYILALPGDGIVQNYTKFLLAKSRVSPDLYVFSIVDNDLIYDRPDKYSDEGKIYEFLQKSCPKQEFIYKWEDENWLDVLKNGYIASFSDEFSNRCWVETAVKEITRQDDRVFFFGRLSAYELNLSVEHDVSVEDKLSRDIENMYINLIINNGGTVINRIDMPIKNGSVSNKEGHPSKEVHRVYAESLYQEITANPRWGFISN